MKIFTILIAFALSYFTFSVANSQPIIQSFLGGEPGDIITYKDCDSSSVNAGPSGANMVWDFSNLSVKNTRFEQILNPAFAPQTNEFPEANYCRYVFPIPESYTFYKSTANELLYYGFSMNSMYLKYSDPIKLMQFPFTYNNSFIDTGFMATNISQTTLIRTNIADGYGTLFLPNASYDNVLRIKTTGISIDSNYSTGILSTSYLTEYNYYKPDIAGSLLIISEANNDSATIFKVVLYNYDPIISTPENKVNSFNIYPNPASDNIKIENADPQFPVSEICIYDISGRKISVMKPENESSARLNISGLKNGIYIIRIIIQDEEYNQKLIIKH